MADLQKPIRQMEQRLGDVSREILRIEAHLRRGEHRAASARIEGARAQLSSLRKESGAPLQLMVVGSQLGLLSGKGSWLRGRIPAAIVCGVGGWMYGQSILSGHHRELEQLWDHVDYLESHLHSDGASEDSESSGSTADSTARS